MPPNKTGQFLAKIPTDLISKILTTDVFTLAVVVKISITRWTLRCVVPTHRAPIRQNCTDICASLKMRGIRYRHRPSRTSTEDVIGNPLTTVSQCHHKANAVRVVLLSAMLASISRIRIQSQVQLTVNEIKIWIQSAHEVTQEFILFFRPNIRII